MFSSNFDVEKKMSNWAEDQRQFMKAADQTTDRWNPTQAERYAIHVREEAGELDNAVYNGNTVEALDGAVDTIVTAIGFILSLGIDPDAAWQAVNAANRRKILPNGKTCRRSDGQVGKPPGWYGPEEELQKLIDQARPKSDR